MAPGYSMPRMMRVEYPGAIYHVMDRGDRRENKEDRLLAYPWSSWLWYLAAPEHRPGWIRVDRLLGEHGIQQDSAAGRQEFKQKMLDLMEGKLGENHSGELHRESAEQNANRIIAEELSRLGWKESDLSSRLKNDPGKLLMAVRVRKETTLPIRWIATRLQM